MNKYPKYKDSGIEWLGNIPEHWEVRKLKNDSTIKNGATPSTNNDDFWDGDVLWITPAEINDITFIDKSKRKITQQGYESCGTNLVPEDSIILTTRAPIGKLVIAKKTLCTNQGCKSIIPISFNTKFQFYQLKIRKKELNALGTGTTFMELGNFELKNLQYVAPTKPEQTTIANFLDHKLEKIDRFIIKKKQLIKLLIKKKTAIINQAVTKGLNPNAKMKDSGIEWLGDIPKHWEVRKLKELCVGYGRIGFRGYKTTDLVNKGEGAITISPSNMKANHMTFEKCSYLSWGKYEQSPEIQIFNNDIIMVKTGSTFGKVGIVKNLTEKATINPQLLVFKNIKINPDYLYNLLKTSLIQNQVKKEVIGSTIPTISQSKILHFKLVLPPMSTIEKILNFIKTETTKIEKTITTLEKEITLVEEYKTALIAEAVTGKIDVRDFEIPELEMPFSMAAEEVVSYSKEN